MPVQCFGPFRLNASKRLLERDGTPVVIGGRVLDLLISLTERPGTVLGVRELMALVWPDVTVEEANLRVSLSALRKTLGDGKDGARYIVNVPGRGYSFVAPVRSEGAEESVLDANNHRAPRSRPVPEIPQLFVGRQDTVSNLSRLLISRRFVSVVGPGGIGKTTVALAVADAMRSDFDDDCVCFIDGGAISDPDHLPRMVAAAVGCLAEDTDSLQRVGSWLADRRTLVILDSCEHLIEAAAELSEYLFHASERVHLLITSREALRVDGENVHLLEPLRYPLDQIPTAVQAMSTPAVQLFMARAAASGHMESLGDEDAPVVSNICRRLDGIALAIELVASRVGVYGIHGTADLLDSGAELVLQGRRNASPRHQTLQALHDWSYRLLSAEEQRVLARLSVFAGELTLAAAHAVVGDIEEDRKAITRAIASLGDKSLVQVCSAHGSARYRLRDTTRAYASHKLVDRGEQGEMARRYVQHLNSVLEQTKLPAPVLGDGKAPILSAKIGNFRDAIAGGLSSAGDPSRIVGSTAFDADVSSDHTRLRECQEWRQQAVDAVPDSGRAASPELDLQEVLEVSIIHLLGNGDRSTAERGVQRG
jgi:predicted ATPase/DNA-binding winged helix-turn-helix (wHTH) protein